MKMTNPTTGAELEVYINGLYGSDIEVWGDSLVDQDFTQYLNPLLNGRESEKHGYSSKTSSFIREEFIANADITKSQVFLVGRNNPQDTEIIIDDLRAMINHLGHTRYLILNPPNGGYWYEMNDNVTDDRYTNFVNLENNLKYEYPNNFLNLRKAVINGWDMGNVKLLNSFVQPAVSGNVQVNVSDSNYLNTLNSTDESVLVGKGWNYKVRIGSRYNADLYSIISVDDSTHITLQLLEPNVVAEGGTVENKIYFDGSVGALMVMQELDWQTYNKDTAPSTFRADSVHFKNPEGRILVAEIISKFLNARFI